MFSINIFLFLRTTAVFVLLLSPSSAEIKEDTRTEELPTVALKEVLRQVFRLPDNEPSFSSQNSQRSLRYMMKLYKKVLDGHSQLPGDANTVRSVTPMEAADIPSSMAYDRRHSLLYNLTINQQERVLKSYLHLMGHKTPNRPSRLLLYIDSLPNGPSDKDNNQPVMMSFVDQLPMDIDVSHIVKKMTDSKHPSVIRLQEEQLRRGRWVTAPLKRLSRKFPLLVIVSTDPQLFDQQTFGNGVLESAKFGPKKSSKTLETISETEFSHEAFNLVEDDVRLKRSISNYLNDNRGNYESPVDSSSSIDESVTDDKYLIQRQALESTLISNPLSSERHLNNRGRLEYFGKDPSILTNSVIHEFRSYEDNPKVDNSSKVKIKLVRNHKRKKMRKNNHETRRERKRARKVQIRINNDDEDDEDDRLLLPLEAYRPWPKSERVRQKKKKKKQSDGDSLVTWDNWDYQRSSKWRKKNKKGKRKNKKSKGKHIPDHWFHTTLKRHGQTTSADKTLKGDSCQKQELFVDFRRLGWDKIIVAPNGFQTYFCAGHCPAPLTSADAGTNHAVIQSLLRATKLSPNLPDVCCVPATLESVSILYKDVKDRIILKTFPNMIVKSCSCQ